MPHAQPNQLIYVIFIPVILVMLYLRLRRMMKPQPLKLNRLWIGPPSFFWPGLAWSAPRRRRPPTGLGLSWRRWRVRSWAGNGAG